MRLLERFVAVEPPGCQEPCVGSCRLSGTWSCVDYGVRQLIETVFGRLSLSIVTVSNWKLSSLYGADAQRSNLVYRRLAISSATSDAKAAISGRFTYTFLLTLNVGSRRTVSSKSKIIASLGCGKSYEDCKCY